MTGRDVIVYILTNHLEDSEIFKDGAIAGFMTVEDAAVACGVGPATAQDWIESQMIPSIQLGNVYFIPDFIAGLEPSK